MSGIALILKKDGFEVSGSDKNYGDMIDILEKNDIHVYIGSNADLVKDADIVVYTSAINQHDPEFVRAKSLGIPTYERAKFLGLLLSSYKRPICICGTHRKNYYYIYGIIYIYRCKYGSKCSSWFKVRKIK